MARACCRRGSRAGPGYVHVRVGRIDVGNVVIIQLTASMRIKSDRYCWQIQSERVDNRSAKDGRRWRSDSFHGSLKDALLELRNRQIRDDNLTATDLEQVIERVRALDQAFLAALKAGVGPIGITPEEWDQFLRTCPGQPQAAEKTSET